MVQEDELLTKEEAAKYLRVSRATLGRIMKEITHIKIGRRVLFRKSDIEKYLQKKTIKK